MDLRKQIITALGLEEKTSLEFQAKLTDGTIVVSPAPELEAGVEINILTEDGSTMPLAGGSYETEDGVGFTVVEDGIVDALLTEEKEAPSEEEDAVEVEAAEEEADVADWAGMEKRIKNLEDAVADLKADKDGGDDEVETEDGGEEELSKGGPKSIKKTEVVEFRALKAENKELKKMLKEAGANKLNLNKFSTTNTVKTELSKTELKKLSSKDRFLYNLNN